MSEPMAERAREAGQKHKTTKGFPCPEKSASVGMERSKSPGHWEQART